MLLYLNEPVGHVVERLFGCAVVSKHDALSAFVVRLGYGPESFLPCGVPNLHFNVSVVYCHSLDFVVDADRSDMIVANLIFGETQQQGCFAHSRVAN